MTLYPSDNDEHALKAGSTNAVPSVGSEKAHARGVSSSTRWRDALMTGELVTSSNHAAAGQNSARARWRRSLFYARILSDDPHDEWSTGKSEKIHKRMEERYWLEMVDKKHRKASNLNKYHEHWKTQYNGSENFFFWLDLGAGKDLDLDECPRERLDKECVIYLSREQRLNYLVEISKDGKLTWARTRGKHKDADEGRGIVDVNSEDHETTDIQGDGDPLSEDESSIVVDLGVGPQALQPTSALRQLTMRLHTVKPHMSRRKAARGSRVLKEDKTWIFVVDACMNMYVGIKQAGRFQHSSFLFGARVMVAGLIKARSGTLTSLIPLSGHYKAGTPHFKRFVELLYATGCDMSHVSIGAGLVTIGAVETYGKLSKFVRSAKAALFCTTSHGDYIPRAPTHEGTNWRNHWRLSPDAGLFTRAGRSHSPVSTPGSKNSPNTHGHWTAHD